MLIRASWTRLPWRSIEVPRGSLQNGKKQGRRLNIDLMNRYRMAMDANGSFGFAPPTVEENECYIRLISIKMYAA